VHREGWFWTILLVVIIGGGMLLGCIGHWPDRWW
jgi:hypothetical protein